MQRSLTADRPWRRAGRSTAWTALVVALACLATAGPATAEDAALAEPVASPELLSTELLTTETLTTETLTTEEGGEPAKPEPDKNGCGPGWVAEPFDGAADNPGGFAFKEFCDKHDVCYGTKPAEGVTPEAHKKKCDDEFRAAMLGYCEKVEGAKIGEIWKISWPDKGKPPKWEKVDLKWNDEAARKHCKAWAEAYYKIVSGPLGKKAFDAAQAKIKEGGEEGLVQASYLIYPYWEPVATEPVATEPVATEPVATP